MQACLGGSLHACHPACDPGLRLQQETSAAGASMVQLQTGDLGSPWAGQPWKLQYSELADCLPSLNRLRTALGGSTPQVQVSFKVVLSAAGVSSQRRRGLALSKKRDLYPGSAYINLGRQCPLPQLQDVMP